MRSARRWGGSTQRGARRRLATFEASVGVLAASLARLAAAREPVADGGGCANGCASVGSALGMGDRTIAATALAEQALADTLDG